MQLAYSEMKRQFDALRKTIDCVNAAGDGARKLFERAKPRSLVFLGCGQSYRIAKSLALAAGIHLKLPAIAVAAGDFMLHAESYCSFLDGALAVTLSRSGCEDELSASVNHLKAATGAPVLAISCAEASGQAGLGDFTVELPWAFDTSACQTRSASCLYAAGMLLLFRLAGCDKQAEGLERAAEGLKEFIYWFEGDLKFAASKAWKNAAVLADAELAGVAEAGALAVQEICRRPCVFCHLLDLRCGPMATVGKDTLVIAALTDGNQHELALLADAAKTGAELVVYSDIALDGLPDAAANISFGRSLPHAARGLPFLLIEQAIACHKAAYDGVEDL